MDPRAQALASYLRARAADFSMSADVTAEQHIAQAGMVLLDAAALIEAMAPGDERLHRMGTAGWFESTPDGLAVVDAPALRHALQRPLAGPDADAQQVVALLMQLADGDDA